MAEDFHGAGKRLICPVNLVDIAVHPQGQYPDKCKARGCCEPVWEVNESWEPIDDTNKAIRDAFYKKHS